MFLGLLVTILGPQQLNSVLFCLNAWFLEWNFTPPFGTLQNLYILKIIHERKML